MATDTSELPPEVLEEARKRKEFISRFRREFNLAFPPGPSPDQVELPAWLNTRPKSTPPLSPYEVEVLRQAFNEELV